MRTPNTTFRAVRVGMLLSQDGLAAALREQVPTASKRLVQRWESGTTTRVTPQYARALESLTGLPLAALGLESVTGAAVRADSRGGHDVDAVELLPAAPAGAHRRAGGLLSGIWLSRYAYHSSGRDQTFSGAHHVVIVQHGGHLSVQSLPGSASSKLTLELDEDNGVVEGTWVEHTDPGGYYRGARYHGVLQLDVDPTGHKMNGKWVGIGSDRKVNTGPWEFILLDADTTKPALERWNRAPEE